MINFMDAQSALIKAQSEYIAALHEFLKSGENTQALNPFGTASVTITPVCNDLPTLKQVAYDFLKSRKGVIKNSSYQNYVWSLRRDILPALGDYKINDINAEVLQTQITNLSERLSPKSVRERIMLVKNILHFAEERGLIVLKAMRLRYPKAEKQEYKVLSDSDYDKLYTHCLGSKKASRTGLLIALEIGARIGEICGLKWSDVDFQRGTIRIRRTVKRTYDSEKKTTYVEITSPKTESSNREIVLTDAFCEILKRKYDDGDDAIPPDTFICSGRPTPLDPRTMRQTFKRILRALEIEDIKFHSIRHSFATRAIANGADIKSVSAILGHSDSSITLDIYTSCTNEMKKKAIEIASGCNQIREE